MPVMAANQLLVQVDGAGGRPDTVILTIGHGAPPPVIGTPEQQLAQLQSKYPTVPIHGLARVSLSPARLREWVDVLQTTLKRLEEEASKQRGEQA
jgi:hypothetical protein